MGRLKTHVPTAELIARAANAGHVLASEHLLKVARSLAPIEEMELERSAQASVDEAALTAKVSFSALHAIIQHENLSYQHDAGKQAKYLEGPSVTEVSAFAQLMAKGAKAAMR